MIIIDLYIANITHFRQSYSKNYNTWSKKESKEDEKCRDMEKNMVQPSARLGFI